MGTPEHAEGPERVAVVGAGVGGLAATLALARAGHPVTLVDRDPFPTAADPEAAFATERAGAPQVHHTHGLLARLVVELRRAQPDVLDDILAAGGTTLPALGDLGEPQPGDEDLAVLIVGCTTLDWALRRKVLAEPNVEVRTGAAVTGLVDAAGSDRTVGGNAEGPGGDASVGFRKLMAAAATDPVLGRGLARLWHLLHTPAALAGDMEFGMRPATVMSDPDAPVPPDEGPAREELLATVAASAMKEGA